MLKESRRVILLSGTPALAKPKELFTLIHVIRPDVFNDMREFGMRFCDPTPNKWRHHGLDFEGASCSRELHFIL